MNYSPEQLKGFEQKDKRETCRTIINTLIMSKGDMDFEIIKTKAKDLTDFIFKSFPSPETPKTQTPQLPVDKFDFPEK